MRPRRAWTSDRGPRGPHEPSVGPDQDLDVHARAPVLDRPRIAAPAPVRAGEEGAVHHVVAVLGHLLGREQKDRRGPEDRLRQGLDDPRSSGPAHAQKLSDHRLHDVLAQVHRSRPRRPGQARDGGYPSTPSSRSRASSPSNSSSVARGALHGDGPLLPGPWGCFFYAHDTPRGWAIIISPPENDPRHPQNNLPGRGRRRTSRTAGKLFKGPPDLFSSPDPQHIDQEPDPRRIRCARPAVLRCASTHRKVRRGRARQRKYSRGHALPREKDERQAHAPYIHVITAE